MSMKVDFLGIGAQKSATTWLDENLRKHPEIWMPPIKELHYFDRLPEPDSSRKMQNKSFVKIYKNKLKKRGNRLPILKRALNTTFNDPFTIYWLYKYFYRQPCDSWYLDLFTAGGNKIKGEITPEYSILNEQRVRYINNLLPDTKIIFLMRNPIDRCWSQLRFNWRHEDSLNFEDMEMIKNFINSPEQQLRNNYLKIINLWKKYYGDDLIFAGFYEDIQFKPEEFYKSVTNFLGVDENFIPAGLRRKINTTEERSMPDEIRKYISRIFHPLIKELSVNIGGHAESWLIECEKNL